MANNQTDNSRNATQQGMSNTDKQNQQQKKGFEQGNGNNSTTADPKNKLDQKTENQSQDSSGQNQSKITNQDSKITNKDEALKKDPKAQGETNDDEDVDENAQLEGYKEEPEIDTPVRGNEKTEKKIPEMKK